MRTLGPILSLGLVACGSSSPLDEPVSTPPVATAPAPAPVPVPVDAGIADDRVVLPGMSIEIPGTPIVTGDYRSGSAKWPSEIVTWRVGRMTPEPQALYDTIASQLAAKLLSPPSAMKLGDAPAWVGELAHGSTRIAVVIGTCGGRTVQLVIQGDRALADRIGHGFRCVPDPDESVDPRVAVQPRPGWHRIAGDNAIRLANDAAHLYINLSTGPNGEQAKQRWESMFALFHFEAKGEPTTQGTHRIWRGAFTIDGAPHPGAIVTWPCTDTTMGFAYVTSLDGAKLDDGIAVAATGWCLAKGEAPPAFLAPP